MSSITLNFSKVKGENGDNIHSSHKKRFKYRISSVMRRVFIFKRNRFLFKALSYKTDLDVKDCVGGGDFFVQSDKSGRSEIYSLLHKCLRSALSS